MSSFFEREREKKKFVLLNLVEQPLETMPKEAGCSAYNRRTEICHKWKKPNVGLWKEKKIPYTCVLSFSHSICTSLSAKTYCLFCCRRGAYQSACVRVCSQARVKEQVFSFFNICCRRELVASQLFSSSLRIFFLNSTISVTFFFTKWRFVKKKVGKKGVLGNQQRDTWHDSCSFASGYAGGGSSMRSCFSSSAVKRRENGGQTCRLPLAWWIFCTILWHASSFFAV